MEERKKLERKKNRFAARLRNSKNINCIDNPCNKLVLCNVGQGTGLEKATILNLLGLTNNQSPPPKFIAEKGETHSFLVFHDTKAAEIFFKEYNGKFINSIGSVVYMSYVENVPSNEIICHHEIPKGLSILENFITMEEEAQFLTIFDWEDDGENSLKNRQVKHYGYEFRYGSNDVDLSNPLKEKIPVECNVLFERLKGTLDLGMPDQLTVNKYKPGQGIPSHVDRHSPFGSTILSLSLGSSVVMDWKHHTGKHVPVVVPSRSLLMMQDEARYDWQHGIQPRTWDPIIETRTVLDGHQKRQVRVVTNDTATRDIRISLTFRWTRQGPCECIYPALCDSVDKEATKDIENDVAYNLEKLHVHQVYEQIAGHFSTTRHKAWPKVVQFMQGVPAGSVVLDLGAGNGKNILPRTDILQVAGEYSVGLLSECKQYVSNIGSADCVRLDLLQSGLTDNCADYIICIAVIHHFSSRARRLQALSTISRLLRPGGEALITVWAKDQRKSNYLDKNKMATADQTSIDIGGIYLPIHENRTQFKQQDLLVPWKLRSISDNKLSSQPQSTLLRYYHVFEDNELRELCEDIQELEVKDSFYEEGNWCVVCKKING